MANLRENSGDFASHRQQILPDTASFWNTYICLYVHSRKHLVDYAFFSFFWVYVYCVVALIISLKFIPKECFLSRVLVFMENKAQGMLHVMSGQMQTIIVLSLVSFQGVMGTQGLPGMPGMKGSKVGAMNDKW